MSVHQKIKPGFLLLCLLITGASYGQTSIKKDSRVLIASGGGARGAWGVGLVQALIKRNKHGYDAAFGTSTGSLMAPYVLLGSIDSTYLNVLENIYTHVTQDSIFNVNPFKLVTTDSTVTSRPRGLVILARALSKKKTTFGESLNLRSLIHRNFDQPKYDLLKRHHKYLAVAVTNMATADVEIVSANQAGCADSMANWIWASACEPLWMSYYPAISLNTGKLGYYVDGGVRDVVPIQQGIKYAVDSGIPNVDVIINNGRQTLSNSWRPDSAKLRPVQGLLRLLEVYNAGTIAKDTLVGDLMTQLLECSANCSDCKSILNSQLMRDSSEYNIKESPDETITVNLYFMDNEVASSYRDELAFAPGPMKILVDNGKNYFNAHPNNEKVITYQISAKRFKRVFKHLYKKK